MATSEELLAACEKNNPGYHEQQRALVDSDVKIICPFCNQFIP